MDDLFTGIIRGLSVPPDKVEMPPRKWNDTVESRQAARRKKRMEKFWTMIDKTTPCWLWTGPASGGYPRFCLNGVTRQCSTIAYEELIGPVMPGKRLIHSCSNILCVNPDHMVQAWSSREFKRSKVRMPISEQVKVVQDISRKRRVLQAEEHAVKQLRKRLQLDQEESA